MALKVDVVSFSDRALADFSLKLKNRELRPIIIGGMGVDISNATLALEAARLGGIGHISDAMSPFVSDKRFDTKFVRKKSATYHDNVPSLDKSQVHFDLADLRDAQMRHVSSTIAKKRGDGMVFINVMEKLNMGAANQTLGVRLNAALDGGIDGITLSAGLHMASLGLMRDNPRFRDAMIGIIVSSARALKIFLRSASREKRLPDYIVVEGPLAGGHLGFGDDWREHSLKNIVVEVVEMLKKESLEIPVIPAGGIFTGTDAVRMIELGAAGVQVATRFTITEECGLPTDVKQRYFDAKESDIEVTTQSPTGYPLRMLKYSPCLNSNVRPSCEAYGYVLNDKGQCQYIDAWEATPRNEAGQKLPVKDKICLCYHFSRYNCWTCGHYVYRLKDTSITNADGTYQLLTAEHVFNDYLFSKEDQIVLPVEPLRVEIAGCAI